MATTWLVEPTVEADLATRAATIARTSVGLDNQSWLSVVVRGRDVVAQGESPSAEARRQALDDLRQIAGLRRVEDRITVGAVQSALVWNATREADRIVTSGQIPTEIDRANLSERLQQAVPGLQLEDRAKPGSVGLAGFAEAASFGLTQLALLSRGSVALSDSTLSLRGEADSAEAYKAVLQAWKNPPAGFATVSLDLTPPAVRSYVWSAAREADRVVLSGHVPSEAARSAVLAAAQRADPGVLEVSDRMQAARGLGAGIDYQATTDFALQQLGQMRRGVVELSEGVLSARGEAADKDALAAVTSAMQASLPTGLTRGAIDLTAPVISPYTFSARRTPDSLILTGYFPDARTREEVTKLVRTRFFTERVVDQAHLADGAPPRYLGGVSLALEQLSLLAQGEASLRDTMLSLTGETLYAQAAERMRVDLPKGVPLGWSASTDIRVRGAEPLLDSKACGEEIAKRLARGQIEFEAASPEIAPSSFAVLDEVAGIAKRCPEALIEVAAHTDQGSAADPGRELSQLRAQAVLDYLAKAGVSAKRLTAVGYGGTRPIAPNDDDAGKAKNRRIELVVKS